MAKFKIGQRVLLLFILVSLIPLLIVNVVLVTFAQRQLRQEANFRQKLAASQTAERVDNFLGSKVNVLIFQSQTSSVREFQATHVSLNLAALIKQDRDLERVALVDKQGLEQVVLNREELVTEHNNVAQSDAFKAATFLAGKEYIGPVNYDADGKPHVTIAIPMIRFTEQQDLTHLSTAEFGQYRTPDDIQGVLIAEVSLSDLWQSVLSTKIGQDGYAYVVDDKGNLIAYPDTDFLTANQNISQVHEVQHFLKGNGDVHESLSEKGAKVLSTHQAITRTNWAVIVEEPIASVFASITTFYRLSIFIFTAVVIVAVSLSLFFRKQLLTPIRRLAAGAKRLGGGDFSYVIPVSSHDELGDLAHTFNDMGQSIQALVGNLQKKNITLGAEHDKLSNIIGSVSDGVVAINSKQEIVSINPPAAQLIGHTPQELIGKPIATCFPLVKANQPFLFNFARPGIYHYAELVLPKADHVAYLDLVVAVLENHPQDMAAIITIHDLTPSRELEVMKLDFVAIAAHELRTPLTVVRGYLNLISHDATKQLSILNIENLQRALAGTAQLNNLINNLLNVSRIERDQMRVVMTKVDLADLLYKVVSQQQVTAKLKGQSLSYSGPSSGLLTPADASSIGEVMNNLLSNALKYTPPAGTIEVSLTQTGQELHVAVKDSGPGIPKAAQGRLFTKFYRVEHSLTTGNRGTGLGLYISKTIIGLHNGKIGVVSRVGEGSTFYFILPVYEEAKHARLIKKEAKELVGVHGWVSKHITR